MMQRSGKRRRNRARPKPTARTLPDRNQALRAGLIILLVGLVTALYPTQQYYEYSTFRAGTIATSEVIAPEAFPVYKSDEVYQAELSSARRSVPPILILDPSVQQRQIQALNAFLADLRTRIKMPTSPNLKEMLVQQHPATASLTETTFQILAEKTARSSLGIQEIQDLARKYLLSVYEDGLIGSKTEMQGYPEPRILIKDKIEARQLDQLHDMETLAIDLQTAIQTELPEVSQQVRMAIRELVMAFLIPNITYDREATLDRRKEATQSISRIKETVLKGERIIDEHDRITIDHIDKLNSLVNHMNQRSQNAPLGEFAQMGARAVLSALILAIFYGFISLFKPAVFRRVSNLVLFGIIILMPTLVAHYAAEIDAISPFLVPIALSAMLATVLFDAEIGMIISLVNASLCASMLGELQYGLIYLITGVIGAYSVREVRHRSDFYRSIVYLVAGYVLTITATSLLLLTYANTEIYFSEIQRDLLVGIFTACASSVLTIGLLPIFESVFDVVTPITLLELSDLNRPLLRNLAIRAPGTYSHSMNMANLSEAAADAIGADRLLARVGCYYHDIGKMIRPQYFIENQKGINPHDELQPKMSALILISHVKDGVELAEEEGLPKALIDLIPQHHGTSEIASFKHRALEQGDKQSVRDEDFRYPGPKPQTKEAGIINVADAVESATRTLSGNDPDQIRSMVQTIVKGRFTAGELDECDLTLRDVTRIQDAFMPVMMASRHNRVPYPWQVKQQRAQPRRAPDRERAR